MEEIICQLICQKQATLLAHGIFSTLKVSHSVELLLRLLTFFVGKIKPTYAPHAVCGVHVIIINTDKAVLTGKKLDQKSYKWHTGWIGGLKEIKYSDMMANQSDRAMTIAVEGMLPNNTLGRAAAKRLRVYKGAEHNNAAQKPVKYEL